MDIIRLLLSPSWPILILAAITSLLSGITTTGIIVVINNVEVNPLKLNTVIIWVFIGLCFLRFISHFISQTLLIYLAQEIMLNLRILLIKKILGSPLFHLEKLGNHRLLATLTDDIQSISNLALIMPRIFVNSIIVISCLSYLCWLSPSVFALIVVFLILGITSYQLIANKAREALSRAREKQDQLFNSFRGITEGTKELILHDQKREMFFNDLQIIAESYRHENVVGTSIFSIAASWSQILFFVAIGLVIFLLPSINNVHNQALSGYVLTLTYLIVPLDMIIGSLSEFSRVSVALEKIKLLDLKLIPPFEENSSQEKLNIITSSDHNSSQDDLCLLSNSDFSCQRLELLGVTYKYQNELDNSLFTIGPIDLTFSAGEIVFLIGGNGSGKSTLLKLLTGLYTPESGKIIVNDKPIVDEDYKWYRQNFSVVFFDFYLFENLFNLGTTFSDSQISDYLTKLNLAEKVEIKNGIISTTKLSQGQRKRLALLTAYLEDRPIYVFDEWACDQDPMFKKFFYMQILPELKSQGKLIIAVTHDDQYYHLSDRIIKLNNGKIENSTQELIRK